MAREDKDFTALDAEVIETLADEVRVKVDGKEFLLPKQILPKGIKEKDHFKLVLATLDSYEKRIEGNAKKILNEILGA